MEFLVLLLLFWIVPVVVLFKKGQTGWAWTGVFLGWTCALIWIIAAIATPNRNKISREDQYHKETLAAMSSLPPQAPRVPDTTIEGRLATLDQLLANGRITADEYEERRQAILREI